MSAKAFSVASRLRLDDYLPYRLSVAANAISQLVARAYIERFELQPTQWRVMAVLGEDGACTQQQIGVRTVMDKVTVLRAARVLQQRKLVGREPNVADRRSHRLFLSPAGLRMYRQIAPLALKYEALLLNGMRVSKVQELDRWLRTLQATAAALMRLPPL